MPGRQIDIAFPAPPWQHPADSTIRFSTRHMTHRFLLIRRFTYSMIATADMTPPTFTLADPVRDREILLDLNIEYMSWNSAELEKAFGMSVAAVVGMSIPDYVAGVLDKVCGDAPPQGCFYLVEYGGAVVGMGGLRQIGQGVSELKRVYVRPAYRGMRLGEAILNRLLADAAAFGFRTIRLDSGPFMRAAHRLYEAAGFVDRPSYPEAEVPAVLHRGWRFMERAV